MPSKIQTYDEKPLAIFVAVCTVASCSQYKYESVAGDPLHTRIYTLDNGLKVYMTVNNEEPRIQTYIAVKVDTRNDPEETTRTIKSQVIDSYLTNVIYKGVKEERNKAIYEKVKTMSLDDVKAYQRQLVNDRTYTYAVQGDKSNIDMDCLRTLGPVTEVTQKQIFGY